MSRDEQDIKKSAERFFKDTKGHTMTVLLNEGLYRHLRFRNPERGQSYYWYDLITWPGNLVFRGDGETYAFSRTPDMLGFFAHGLGKNGSITINPHYWAEKLTSHDQSHTYDDEVFRENFKEQAEHLIEDGVIKVGQRPRFREEIQNFLESEDHSTMEAAIHAVEEFEFFNEEGRQYSYEHRSEAIRFEDSWEWIRHCTAYEWWYLWACHAIVSGIKQYCEVFGRSAIREDENPDTQDVSRRGVPIG